MDQQQQKQLDMATIWEYLKQQGFSITLLVVLSYVFWQQINNLHTKLDKCNDEKVEILLNALQDNTRAINNFTNLINDIDNGEATQKRPAQKIKQ